MKRLWPKSLAGQMILLVLAALLTAQAVSWGVFYNERRVAIRAAARDYVVDRTMAMARLLADTPPELHARVVEAASNPFLRFRLTDAPLTRVAADARSQALADAIAAELGPTAREVRVTAAPRHRHERGDDERRSGPRRQPNPPAISIAGPGGGWINVIVGPERPGPRWAWPTIASLGMLVVAVAAAVAFMAWRIARPIRRLAAAADRVGAGQRIEPLPEEGAEDLRRATRAFNRMQDRLHRFVADRTRMLAAISHDLRTPITSMRLHAEFVDDTETRERLIAGLEEMQRMTEATLAFAREDASDEETRAVDLTALLDGLCDELVELGRPVAFTSGERVVAVCRPTALKRALRNLIENAVAYGGRAAVAVRRTAGGGVEITVDDAGPGIPADRLEAVFQPFYRLEESRSRDTGGAGLGLAIARTILRGHGGDVTLANRAEGGLRATAVLPGG